MKLRTTYSSLPAALVQITLILGGTGKEAGSGHVFSHLPSLASLPVFQH